MRRGKRHFKNGLSAAKFLISPTIILLLVENIVLLEVALRALILLELSDAALEAPENQEDDEKHDELLAKVVDDREAVLLVDKLPELMLRFAVRNLALCTDGIKRRHETATLRTVLRVLCLPLEVAVPLVD